MIAKEIAMRHKGGSFRGLVSYLTSSRGKSERIGTVRLSNCVSADVASAVVEVENVQARNHRARHTTYHLMLAFPVGEQPAAEVLEAIERRACAALGFADHQRVSVVHHDTDHLHLHVAINRVSPTTHKVHWPSYSKLVLDRLCVEVERDFGLQPVPHCTRDRQDHLRAIEELRASAQRECSAALREARTWVELHEAAGAHGLRVQLRGNGLILVGADDVSVRASSVARDLSKSVLERRLGYFEGPPDSASPASLDRPAQPDAVPDPRPPDMERVAGFESLAGWIQRGCATGLGEARSWTDVHELAAAHGLRVQLRGNGVVFVAADGLAVKGSSVARDLSKAALERRLGPFETANAAPGAGLESYCKRPMPQQGTTALYHRYREQQPSALERRNRAVEKLREQRGRDDERLRRTSRRRWAAIRLVAKGRVAWMLWSAYARQADRRDRERARRRRHADVRAAVAELPRSGWLDWLRDNAAQGDQEALAALRRRSHRDRLDRNALWGEGSSKPLSQATVDSVTATGTVVYRVPGGSIRDDGSRLHLAGARSSEAAAEVLLRLAYARYGARLGVDGDDAFRAQVVRAAVTTALPITFADERIEQRRAELQRKEHIDGQQGTQRPRAGAGEARTTIPAGREHPDIRARRPRVPKPYGRRARPQTAAQPDTGLRDVSALDVVRFGRTPEVLLPGDARRDVEQRRPGPDPVVRRHFDQSRVDNQPTRKGRGRRQ